MIRLTSQNSQFEYIDEIHCTYQRSKDDLLSRAHVGHRIHTPVMIGLI